MCETNFMAIHPKTADTVHLKLHVSHHLIHHLGIMNVFEHVVPIHLADVKTFQRIREISDLLV